MRTVFVIGAGASKEVNLPTGTDLKNIIVGSFRPPSGGGAGKIWDAMSYLSHQGELGVDFSQINLVTGSIQNAMPLAISIDNYLDAHSENKTIVICGKLAIVHSILKAESQSAIFFSKPRTARLIFSEIVEKTWFNKFIQLITEGPRSSLKHRLSSLVLIIFNYDRCVEHFIFHALQTYYDMNEIDAAELLKGIEIYHPYGSVGSLPCLGRDHPVEFGNLPPASDLPILARQIKTFTESTDEKSSDIVAIRRHMGTALRLVFLGFAFHPRNMELLRPKQQVKDRKVFATCYGLSDSRTDKISVGFGSDGPFSDAGLHFRPIKCNELFDEYSHDFFLTQ